MTTHRHRFLSAHSRQSKNPISLLSGRYDIALIAPSWDNRCESIVAAKNISFGTSFVLRFSTKDDYGIQLKHEEVLNSFVYQRSDAVEIIEGDALDLPGLWSRLWDRTDAVCKGTNEPLRVLVDLSTCPRYYSLGWIAGLIRYGFARSVSVFYAEGLYNEHVGNHLIDYPFTAGKWRATAIPFLRGSPDPLKGKAYLVSVGFEGVKTARVLAREDPDTVAMLLPDPGVEPKYVNETWERNKEIVEQYRIPDFRILRAYAGDAVAAWKVISDANLENTLDESVYYLCCGTKPHSLALTLRAITMEESTVMYNLPARHSFVDVDPKGIYWLYEISDVTAPIPS